MSVIFIHYFLLISKLNYQNLFYSILQSKRRIPKSQQIASDKISYASIDKLREQIQRWGAYTPVHLTNEFIGASKEKIPFRFMCSNSRKKLKSGIGFGFPVVVYTYETSGRAINWVVLFKFP